MNKITKDETIKELKAKIKELRKVIRKQKNTIGDLEFEADDAECYGWELEDEFDKLLKKYNKLHKKCKEK